MKNIKISALQTLFDLLKIISLAGFVALFVRDKFSLPLLPLLVITLGSVLLLFPLRRYILNREEELDKDR